MMVSGREMEQKDNEVLSFSKDINLRSREFSEKLKPIVSSISAFRFLLQIRLITELIKYASIF